MFCWYCTNTKCRNGIYCNVINCCWFRKIENEAIATLFILDWFIDRIETAVNVTSDQFIAKMVDTMEINNRKKREIEMEKNDNDNGGDINNNNTDTKKGNGEKEGNILNKISCF